MLSFWVPVKRWSGLHPTKAVNPCQIMAIERRVEELDESSDVSEDVSLEGSELPMELLGGMDVSPGDVVRIEVISVDPESGMWRGKYSTDKPERSAIDEAVSSNEPMEEM